MRNIIYSLAGGIIVFFLTFLILLPLTDVTDGQGHGPDPGSAEWQRAAKSGTATRKTLSVVVGAITSIIIFKKIDKI